MMYLLSDEAVEYHLAQLQNTFKDKFETHVALAYGRAVSDSVSVDHTLQ